MVSKSLPLIALASALAVAGCNQAPQTTDNAMVNVSDATDLGDTPDNDTAPVVENVSADTTEAVAVAAVPTPAPSTPPAEAAPLTEASTIEKDIRTGSGIQRVRYGDGWAWMRGSQILRTADRDGKNIAYFHRGENKPFFVQRGDRSYAYQGDKPIREFDHDGRARTPDADRSREAVEAARDARTRHDRAEQAREHARPGPMDRDHGDHVGRARRRRPPQRPPRRDHDRSHDDHHGAGDRSGTDDHNRDSRDRNGY